MDAQGGVPAGTLPSSQVRLYLSQSKGPGSYGLWHLVPKAAVGAGAGQGAEPGPEISCLEGTCTSALQGHPGTTQAQSMGTGREPRIYSPSPPSCDLESVSFYPTSATILVLGWTQPTLPPAARMSQDVKNLLCFSWWGKSGERPR